MEVIPKNCVNNFNDFKAVLESRVGLDYYSATDKTNENHLLDQTEWSDIPDDTEFAVATLPSPDVGPQEISYPLNERELYRIKRALLRYEIFCALFYLGSEGQFDKQQQQQQGQHQSQDRHHHHHRRRRQQRLQQQQRHSNKVAIASKQRAFKRNQTAFLREYFNPWEVGELAVVSHFMHDLVRYVHVETTQRLHSSSSTGSSVLFLEKSLVPVDPLTISVNRVIPEAHADNSESMLDTHTFTNTSPCATRQDLIKNMGTGLPGYVV